VTASISRAGSRVARSGGVCAYAADAFGPLAGFLAGVLFAITGVFSSASVAAGLVDSLATLAPALGRPLERGFMLVALYSTLTFVNLRGVAAGTGLAAGMAMIKFTALLLFVALGVTLVQPEHLVWTAAPAPDALGRGTILGMFALAGMEIALGASGEVSDPARTIPRALILAVTLIVLLYLAIQLVAQGILGPTLASSRAPLADALARGGPAGRYFILAAGTVSMFGWLAGDVLGTSRQFFAFGRDGFLPAALAAVHPVSRVPHVAIAGYAAVSCLLAVTGSFAGLAILATVAVVLLYIFCCVAAWWLTRARPRAWLVPLLAVVGLLWVLSSAAAREFLAVAGLLAAAALLYWLTQARRRTVGEETADVG
jgi:basic amino acid/polyamine antiporter, APA family